LTSPPRVVTSTSPPSRDSRSPSASRTPSASRSRRSPRVWEAKLPNKGHVEFGLLAHLAFTASPASIPFFLKALDHTRPRDQLGAERKAWAVAGIAFTAHRSGDPAAKSALLSLLAHKNPLVRTEVIDAVAQLWRGEDERLTDDAVSLFERVIRDDPAFEPRFLAATALLMDERALPLEEDGAVYAFTATFGNASRTVELLGTDTLTDLCSMVVSAFGWDHDHLWAFYLSDVLSHEAFSVSPEGDPWGSTDGPEATPLSATFMPAGHTFKLLYDFGDHNVFTLRFVGVAPRTPRAKYPRVAASKGKAPKQYR